jgi:hypothetical protein
MESRLRLSPTDRVFKWCRVQTIGKNWRVLNTHALAIIHFSQGDRLGGVLINSPSNSPPSFKYAILKTIYSSRFALTTCMLEGWCRLRTRKTFPFGHETSRWGFPRPLLSQSMKSRATLHSQFGSGPVKCIVDWHDAEARFSRRGHQQIYAHLLNISVVENLEATVSIPRLLWMVASSSYTAPPVPSTLGGILRNNKLEDI